MLANASSASATIMTATWKGHVFYGSDGSGLFGVPSALDGKPYTAVFVYDTKIGKRISNSTGDSIRGGTNWGGPSPFLDVTLMITGTTVHVGTSFNGTVSNDDDPAIPFQRVQYSAGTVGPDTTLGFNAFGLPSPPPLNLDTSYHMDFANCKKCGTMALAIGTYAHLNVTSLDVTHEAAGGRGGVPEPSTWALMITGFGLAGASLRRPRSPHRKEVLSV